MSVLCRVLTLCILLAAPICLIANDGGRSAVSSRKPPGERICPPAPRVLSPLIPMPQHPVTGAASFVPKPSCAGSDDGTRALTPLRPMILESGVSLDRMQDQAEPNPQPNPATPSQSEDEAIARTRIIAGVLSSAITPPSASAEDQPGPVPSPQAGQAAGPAELPAAARIVATPMADTQPK
jgi:hypothetical protein